MDPWLKELSGYQLHFIPRLPSRYRLSDANGECPTWQITRGKCSQDHRQIWDLRQRQYCKTGIIAVPVRHSQVAGDLWLVVSPRTAHFSAALYIAASVVAHAVSLDGYIIVLDNIESS